MYGGMHWWVVSVVVVVVREVAIVLLPKCPLVGSKMAEYRAYIGIYTDYYGYKWSPTEPLGR